MSKRQSYIILGITLILIAIYIQLYRSGLFFHQAIVVANHSNQSIKEVRLVFPDDSNALSVFTPEVAKQSEILYAYESKPGELRVRVEFVDGVKEELSCGYTEKGMTHLLEIRAGDKAMTCRGSSRY